MFSVNKPSENRSDGNFKQIQLANFLKLHARICDQEETCSAQFVQEQKQEVMACFIVFFFSTQ